MPERRQRRNGGSATEELGVRTAKTASFLISGRFIAIIISAAMFIIIARLLGPYEYGIYVLIMSAAGIISALGNPNIGPYLKEKIPRISPEKRKSDAGVALGDAALLSLGVGAMLLLVAVALGNVISSYFLHTSNYGVALVVGFISILLTIVYSTLNDALISIDDGSGAAAAAIVHSVLQAATSISLVLLGFGIVGALAGFSVGLSMASLLELYMLNSRYRLRFPLGGMLKRFRRAISFSKYLTASGVITGILTNISTVYLGFIVLPKNTGVSTIGDYGISQKVLSALDIIIGSISLALIPMFSEAKKMESSGREAGRLFHYSIYLSLLFATPLVLFITIFSRDLILLLFTGAYLGATLYMQLITMSLFASIFFTYGTNYLIGIGQPKKVLKYAAITGIATLAVMIPLTMYLGVVGTIIAIFYIGNLLPSALYLNYIKGRAPDLALGRLARVILANLLPGAVLCALALSGINPIIALISGAALYFVMYPPLAAKARAVESKDIELMRRSGSRLPVVGNMLDALLRYASRFA